MLYGKPWENESTNKRLLIFLDAMRPTFVVFASLIAGFRLIAALFRLETEASIWLGKEDVALVAGFLILVYLIYLSFRTKPTRGQILRLVALALGMGAFSAFMTLMIGSLFIGMLMG